MLRKEILKKRFIITQQFSAETEQLFGAETQQQLADIEIRQALLNVEQEKEILLLRAQAAEQLSEAKNKELMLTAIHLAKRNEFLKSLALQIEPHASANSAEIQKLAATLLKSIASASGDEVRIFEQQFEKLHYQLIQKLHQRSHSLTPTEIKICVYTHLNLSLQETADLLFVSVETVKTHRRNIRKKLMLKKQEGLATFLSSL